MIAVIQTGGKQYVVKPGDRIEVEKIKGKKEGDEVVFEKVLLVEEKDKIDLGTPLVKGASVKAKILESGRGPKMTILKYKPKTRYSVKMGHRQPFMKVEIKEISS